METGKYKNEHGHELNVVQVDHEGKRVEVDYGNGHFHWWGEDDYLKWEKIVEGEAVVEETTPTEQEWQTDEALENLDNDAQVQDILNDDVPREVEDNELAANEEIIPETEKAPVKKAAKKKTATKKSPATKSSTKKKPKK